MNVNEGQGTKTPESEPDEWAECLRISELPDVDEALRLFSEGESSEDQAVCIVRAVRRDVMRSCAVAWIYSPEALKDEHLQALLPGGVMPWAPITRMPVINNVKAASKQAEAIQPVYYVAHPDGSFSAADPQPNVNGSDDFAHVGYNNYAAKWLPEALALDPMKQALSQEVPLTDALPAAPAQGVPDSITWPKARDVGRMHDMGPDGFIRVLFDVDSDVIVELFDGQASASVEFCTVGSGGGKSPRTREALIALMVAMEADNAADPGRDWWALRMAAAPQPKGGQE